MPTETITATVTPLAQSNPLFDLGNPVWQGIGAVIGLIALLVAVAFWLADRRKKELSYQIVSDTPLFSFKEEAELQGRLSILFDGQPAQQLAISSIILTISNSGNVAIDDEDYSGPIKFAFGQQSEVLTASVISTLPDTFDAKVGVEENKLLLMPLLLNKRQSVVVKTLVKQKDGIYPSAHIKDVTIRGFIPPKPNNSEASEDVIFGIMATAIGFIFAGIALPVLGDPTYTALWVILLSLSTISFLLAAFDLIYHLTRIRRK